MRKYRPTERDKEIVLRMAAIPNISLDNVAFAITNERTGKAIDRKTLEKCFAKELELAASNMQNLVMKSFLELIAEKNWPAVKMGLMNYCNIKDDGEIAANANVQVNMGRAQMEGIVVTFEKPKQFDAEGNVIDRSIPPPDMDGPRPIGKQEMQDEARLRYPHRIEGAAAPAANGKPQQEEEQQYIHTPRIGKPWIGPR
jgi:hypothetical protein